jgi:hypothetical protein
MQAERTGTEQALERGRRVLARWAETLKERRDALVRAEYLHHVAEDHVRKLENAAGQGKRHDTAE